MAARERLGGVQAATSRIDSAEALLRELNGRLDGPVTWEVKRELVETLVDGIRVDTVEKDGRKEAIVHVTYCFDPPHSRVATHTHWDSAGTSPNGPTPGATPNPSPLRLQNRSVDLLDLLDDYGPMITSRNLRAFPRQPFHHLLLGREAQGLD